MTNSNQNQLSDGEWAALLFAIRSGDCILVLGPGWAINSDGKLLADLLASHLRDQLKSPVPPDSSLSLICEYIVSEKEKDISFLRSLVDTFYKSQSQLPAKSDQQLAHLPFQLVISTCYDDRFYQALVQTESKKPTKAYYDFNGNARELIGTGDISPLRPLFFNLYGSISNPRSLVLSESDLLKFFEKIIKKEPSLPSYIEAEFKNSERKFLFLGFGFRNWYLRMLLHLLTKPKQMSIALEAMAPEPDTVFFFDQGFRIRILSEDPHQFVDELYRRYCQSEPIQKSNMGFAFDIFLSHNSQDKPTVRKLAEALKSRNLRVWLDEEQLKPGESVQEALEKIIQTTHAAAVLFGESGVGPWERPEMRACLCEYVNRKLPVIPVLLPNAPTEPELPLLLRDLHWVDLRTGLTDEGLAKLVWGITGEKPEQLRNGA